jgi:hypothetical protein
MKIILAVVMGMSGLMCLQASGKEPTKADRTKTKLIRELIDGLGNRGVVIKDRRSSNPYLVIPKTFDWKLCKHVYENIEKLMGMGIDAFPELIAHQDDGRFCGFHVVEVEDPTDVGFICEHIITSQVEVFPYDVYAPGVVTWVPHTIPQYDSEEMPAGPDSDKLWKKSWDKWWKKSKDKSLRELQITAAEESITCLRKAKIDDPDFASWRTKQIKGLNKMIAELKQSKKPKRAKFGYVIQFPSPDLVKTVGNEQRYYFSNGK